MDLINSYQTTNFAIRAYVDLQILYTPANQKHFRTATDCTETIKCLLTKPKQKTFFHLTPRNADVSVKMCNWIIAMQCNAYSKFNLLKLLIIIRISVFKELA